jgi:hypothetical protein
MIISINDLTTKWLIRNIMIRSRDLQCKEMKKNKQNIFPSLHILNDWVGHIFSPSLTQYNSNTLERRDLQFWSPIRQIKCNERTKSVWDLVKTILRGEKIKDSTRFNDWCITAILNTAMWLLLNLRKFILKLKKNS